MYNYKKLIILKILKNVRGRIKLIVEVKGIQAERNPIADLQYAALLYLCLTDNISNSKNVSC